MHEGTNECDPGYNLYNKSYNIIKKSGILNALSILVDYKSGRKAIHMTASWEDTSISIRPIKGTLCTNARTQYKVVENGKTIFDVGIQLDGGLDINSFHNGSWVHEMIGAAKNKEQELFNDNFSGLE